MRVTRKIQSMVEAKIRHAIATGPLPHIVRSLTEETVARPETNKANANDAGQSK